MSATTLSTGAHPNFVAQTLIELEEACATHEAAAAPGGRDYFLFMDAGFVYSKTTAPELESREMSM
jgi:hypothetical protein